MFNASDFVIERGVLTKYRGDGGDVVIPYSVTEIGPQAFESCNFLNSVTIPGSVASIGDCAFSYCYDLTEVIIQDGVSEIGLSAFSYCSSLMQITIPDSIISIGGHAFNGCSSLSHITIPDSVKSIGDYAFSGCSSLPHITIPDSVKTIGIHAFSECDRLEYNDYENATYLVNNKNPFYALVEIVNNEITECKIHPDTRIITQLVFLNCKHLTEIQVDPANQYYSSDAYGVLFDKSMTTLICAPAKIAGYYTVPQGVKHISEYAFFGCTGLTGITIPDSVESIGGRAFVGCDSLTEATLLPGVTRLDEFAFAGCPKLERIAVPDSITDVGWKVFSDCPKLKYNTLDGVKYLGNEINPYAVVIGAATNLIRSCNIHSGAKVICSQAFKGCRKLTEITLPNSLVSIGDRAYELCINLQDFTLPDSLTRIGAFAFANCYAISDLILPPGVVHVGNSAFSTCVGLQRVDITSNAVSLGYNAFEYCSGLILAAIAGISPGTGGRAFKECENLEAVIFMDSPEFIANDMFAECASIKLISISNPYKLPEELWLAAVKGFLMTDISKNDPSYSLYCTLLKENAEMWTDAAVADLELLEFMCREKLIPAEDFQEYLEAAQACGNAQCIAMLQEYGARKLTGEEKAAAEELKERTQDAIRARKLQRMHKEGIDGFTFVFSGIWETGWSNQDLQSLVEEKGGKIADNISAGVDYFVTNDTAQIEKNKKQAEKFGVDIITERQFNDMVGRTFHIEECGHMEKCLGFGNGGLLREYCGASKDVVVPDGITGIGDSAFYNLDWITSVKLPDGVQKIGHFTFLGCCGLEHIRIPSSVTRLDWETFLSCEHLTIHAPAGSFAEGFAKRNRIAFIAE